ncbi:MAG: cyanoexosortase B system-associated protein [Cyanobacteria bacterium SBLK]|nr:cyanoexosortase B system-associated protein [Cyanobacteria bacterium SBLK]
MGIAIVLIVILAIGAVPAYLQGEWITMSFAGIPLPVWKIKASWQKPFPVKNLGQIRRIRKEPIDVPGWETLENAALQIGGHEWHGQILARDDDRNAMLFVFPQKGPKEQPGVEWVDVDGFFKWNIDSQRSFKFTAEVGDKKASITARLLLARESRRSPFRLHQTVAVVQWYAWEWGGHYSPLRWFWLDQRLQLQKQRLPWIAVTVRIPVDPKSTLDTIEPDAEALAQIVQASLMENVFSKRN